MLILITKVQITSETMQNVGMFATTILQTNSLKTCKNPRNHMYNYTSSIVELMLVAERWRDGAEVMIHIY